MIKRFSEFINESNDITFGTNVVYGESLFESISNSFIKSINESIYNGDISLEDNILNEGWFTNIFKNAGDKAKEKVEDADFKKEYFKLLAKEATSGSDIIKLGKTVKKEEIKENVWKYINSLCDDAVELIEKLNQKEEDAKLAITKKLTETKEAIDTFVKKSQDTFNKIASESKNAVVDTIAALRVFLAKLAEISTNALKTTGKYTIIAVCLPFVLAYSTYKSIVKLCERLCVKAKNVWNDVENSLKAYGKVLSDWIKLQINKIKDTLKEWSNRSKEEGQRTVQAVAKAYLYVVGVCGLVIDKTSSAIKDTYNSFIESAKDYTAQIKAYISDRWDKVTTWTKEKSGEFVQGVKNVWSAVKDKVNQVVSAGKDAINKLSDYKDDKVGQIESWTDEKKKTFAKSITSWAVKNWGADEVKSWVE